MTFLAATGNKHKLEEFGRILSPFGIRVIGPADAEINLEVGETGETFAENARLKAEAFYLASGLPTIADDSGLCIDALDGRPGVHSSRYCGEDATYPEKFAALLNELHGVPEDLRTARFVSAICCVIDENTMIACEGTCEGVIGYEPRGEGGFGYDPLFYIGGKSIAQMSSAEKDALSHRGKALRKFTVLLDEKFQQAGLESI